MTAPQDEQKTPNTRRDHRAPKGGRRGKQERREREKQASLPGIAAKPSVPAVLDNRTAAERLADELAPIVHARPAD